ncbi:hypothetical protein [Prosthecobacter sp.]|uniref:hypothetical protein n=1 Tax=Prosthecobacter sp. TaxID=1965333 RepID=UPI002488A541|nr:hypothetical protein [Prosthecobacter sp.]MDI1315201.1 hypothetical protein [Prosthecobacter sp.]
MKLLCAIFIFSPVFAGLLHAQEKEWPEVEKFAADIKGVIWDLRGTNSLKHLRYDGEKIFPVTGNGMNQNPYKEHAFVDVGVFQIVFGDTRAAWYFVSDDLKLITPVNISEMVEFKAEPGSVIKPVKNFPQDIQNVVWVGRNQQAELKLRWNGKELEVGAKKDSWIVQKVDAVVANRRVLEAGGENNSLFWLVFSEDGSEATWVKVDDIFGGHASTNPGKAALAARTTGLSPQQNDLANHAEDLLNAGEKMRAATLLRELERKNAANKDALKKLQARFNLLK